jgi:acetoin utilization deacetylase AcuC-like enzyme
MIGVVSDPLFMQHDTGPYHPEQPLRSQYVHSVFTRKDPHLVMVDPLPASVEEIMLNHEKSYVELVKRACCSSRYTHLDSDTVCSEDSYTTALYAAGSVLQLVRMALSGEIEAGFAGVRPPGHHAESDRAMGFCLFNNVAVAAHAAISVLGLEKVLIADIDVHHGNGTQDSFYRSRDVLYFSTHQHPFYPGTGRITETGSGKGEGFTMNCPLRGGKNDSQMVSVYRHVLLPVIRAFKPQLILVSAGFDAHVTDSIGGMKMTAGGFACIAGLIRDAAREAGCPVVYALEGGYNLNALRESVQAVVDVMKGDAVPVMNDVDWPELDEFVKAHSRYWPL